MIQMNKQILERKIGSLEGRVEHRQRDISIYHKRLIEAILEYGNPSENWRKELETKLEYMDKYGDNKESILLMCEKARVLS